MFFIAYTISLGEVSGVFPTDKFSPDGEVCFRRGSLCTKGVFCAQSWLRLKKFVHRMLIPCTNLVFSLGLQQPQHPQLPQSPADLILKLQFAVRESHFDFAVTGNFTANNLGGKFVDEFLLEESLYRSCSISNIVTF